MLLKQIHDLIVGERPRIGLIRYIKLDMNLISIERTHKVVYSCFIMPCEQDHGRNQAGQNAP